MVRTLRVPAPRKLLLSRRVPPARVAVGVCLVLGLMFSLGGCAGDADDTGKSAGTVESSESAGQRMAGAPKQVVIPRAVLADRPRNPILDTPKSAVLSYLDWVSFAYRITESAVATPTMSTKQEVMVDSYVQFNLQKSRRLDQTLDSITFGTASIGSKSAELPAREKWSYRYVSISDPNKTAGGPYTASYDTTYTLVVNDAGGWVVDSVKVSAIGDIK